jgi:3-oxoacyl-[acyl-carrier protein] reductase
MTDLSGKVALVTGASRGIGLGIAESLARSGCRVACVATSESSAERGAAAVRAAGSEALAFAADVRESSRASEIVEATIKEWGSIDVLVNNAGITRDGLLMKMSDEDIDSVIDINLKAAMFYTRAVSRPMIKARGGSIINVSSIVGLMGSAGQSNYAAAKAGLIGLTRSLAAEFGGRSVRVNAIAPGYIQTDMTSELPEGVKAESMKAIPMGRFGDPSDIANGVLFLASEAASYITGTTLVIDGGMSL